MKTSFLPCGSQSSTYSFTVCPLPVPKALCCWKNRVLSWVAFFFFYLPGVFYPWNKRAAPQAGVHTCQARRSYANHVLESCMHLQVYLSGSEGPILAVTHRHPASRAEHLQTASLISSALEPPISHLLLWHHCGSEGYCSHSVSRSSSQCNKTVLSVLLFGSACIDNLSMHNKC